MGEARKEGLKVGFDASVRLEFHAATVSSDGGLLAYRDVDEALPLTATTGATLTDWRTGTSATAITLRGDLLVRPILHALTDRSHRRKTKCAPTIGAFRHRRPGTPVCDSS